jgi:opacity protein-like surface antigen
MKKKLLALTLALSATTAFAQPSNFEGFSAGVSIGAVGVDTKVSSNDGYGFNLGESNIIPGIDLSYSMTIDKQMLIGFGFTYDLAKSKSGQVNVAGLGSIGLEAKDHYSVYVQPQYLLNNTTAVFGKLGYHKTKGTISGDFAANFTSESITGIGFGFGVKTFINNNLFIQAEGQVVNYKEKSFDFAGAAVSYKPKSSAGIVTLGYKF